MLPQEGEEYLAKAVEMRPNLAKYHVNLGRLKTIFILVK